MALDNRYFTTISLNEVFRDKDTGEPLAGGQIYLYKDNNRGVPKLAYTINATPPYTYTALANPITLNSYGTLDSPIYWFPYESTDADAEVELYYVVVTNSAGVTQFTRPAVPDLTDGENPNALSSTITNELSNPQFTDVFIDTQAATTISFTGTSTTTRTIAPDWDLQISHTGAGTLSVARTEILGSQKLPNNPPYVLTITPGANISAVKLVQRLTNNPGIWSPQTSGERGYIAGSILVSDGVGVTMTYAPSTGTSQDFLTGTNSSGSYDELKATFQLAPSDNTDGSDDGYVDIEISLPTSGSAYSVSNIQVVGLETNQTNVPYDQTPAHRNTDRLFNYYKQPFQDKPIPSYLINWDFPFNTVATPTIAASAIGANKSKAIWDNTILFQSVDSGIGVSRAASGGMVLTAATSAGQTAIIQYLPQAVARKVLNEKISSMISSVTDITAGVTATLSIWRTTDAALPAIASNLSIVATLDSSGKPATFNGNWTEVPRGTFGDATFTIRTSSNTNYNRNGFSGWDMAGAATVNTATWVAIVLGIGTMQVGETVTLDSISLQSGDIPTVPAPNNNAGLVTVQTFTSNGTWTKPNGCSRVIVECVGGGGGGGFGGAVTGAGVSGGGGSYARKYLDVSNIATVSVTVGAGGAGGTGGGGGSAGGTTSFGSYCSAGGGNGGNDYSGPSLNGALGGGGITGDILVGGGATMAVYSGGAGAASSPGGMSGLGGGGGSGSIGAGNPGVMGGGGSGGANSNNGGAGGTGIVIVTEYYG